MSKPRIAMASGSLDTNVLLRLLLNDIPEQHESAKGLFKQAGGNLSVADTAIIELAFALHGHYDFSRGCNWAGSTQYDQL